MSAVDLQQREHLACEAFEAYDFGLGVGTTVHADAHWGHDDLNDYTKGVRINSPQAIDSGRGEATFHVRFNSDGSVAQTYALLLSTGDEVGHGPLSRGIFDPTKRFTSVDQATKEINKQPNPLTALIDVVCFNLRHGTHSFAVECIQAHKDTPVN